MPPSYSMMLPGRMSTPLIFMVCSLTGESRRLLAAAGVSGKQRVGIDRPALIPALTGGHPVDREMQMRPGGIGVAGAADPADRIAAPQPLALRQPRRVGVQMGVIIDPIAV